MKKLFIICLALFALVTYSYAQEPTTNWPYLYPEFRSGFVMLEDGATKPYQMNVHLGHSKLHYLDEAGLIKEATTAKMYGAQLGEDLFLLVNDEMLRVVSQSDHGCVTEEVLGDFAALSETGGAYGTSSATSATRRLSSLELDSQINQNHMLLMQSRSDGKMLPLLKTYYLVYPGVKVKATRNEVEKIIPADKKADWNNWRKKNSPKWNNPESLQSVVDFLNP